MNFSSDRLNGWTEFLELCSKAKSTQELDRLFNLFLTIEEKEHLAFRYLIIKGLCAGQMTQRELAKTYKISIAQITRGSNALKMIDKTMKNFLEKNLKL